MSTVHSMFYLVTNIALPIMMMAYKQIKSYSQNVIISKKQIDNNSQGIGQITEEDCFNQNNKQFKCKFGYWALLILSIIFFNALTLIFRKNYTLMILGFIVKIIFINLPQSLIQSVQKFIQKAHFEQYFQIMKSKSIVLYLNIADKLNDHVVNNELRHRDQKEYFIHHFKDSISKLQLDIQQNEQIKNRSFIVAQKKLQNLKTIKLFQNVGVTCDILKNDEVNREILKLLSQKKLPKDNFNYVPSSMIQQPTKDNFVSVQRQTIRSLIYPESASHSLQKNKKISESQKKNIEKGNDKLFMIKRSKTNIDDDFDEGESPIKIKQSKTMDYPQRTERKMQKHNNRFQSFQKPVTQRYNQQQSFSRLSNQNNIGMIDIPKSSSGNYNMKDNIKLKSNITDSSILTLEKVSKYDMTKSLNQVKQDMSSPNILPQSMQISSIEQRSHPFVLNLSSLSNPLIPSATLTKSKILPASLYMSSSNKVIPQNNNQDLKEKEEYLQIQRLSNISQVKTQTIGQIFSESSIPNNVEVSISESQYSDMFESNSEGEEEAKLEVKVEAVVENSNPQKGIRPKLDICYIQLYQNKQIKFLSLYDKLTFHGRILRMYKKPDNYYDLILEQFQSSQKEKKSSEANINVQVTKKVKFRGQAKAFMKYLQKTDN